MSFTVDSLRAELTAHAPGAATGWLVAVSGGMDSACLLTALAQSCGPSDGKPPAAVSGGLPVRAVHVDHGLQAAAADFRRACEVLCLRLGVPLTIINAVVRTGGGVSIEAEAREARYAGLARQLRPGECLLTAHHAEDQAETVLLQLLRGTGLKGLAAMPSCRAWAGGWHLRPLLHVARHDLLSFGAAFGVIAVSDPMNTDLRFDRSYLRTRVWPPIAARWPGAARALSRTARHAADAQALLDERAAATVDTLRDGATLSVTGLRALPAPLQLIALRHWISETTAVPPARRLAEALRQIIAADADQLPAVVWGAHALRRYRNRLFLTAAHPAALGGLREWRIAGPPLELDRGLGMLLWSPQSGALDGARLPPVLTVRRRRGGEVLKPQRRGRTHTLQHLCQEWGVLPWLRAALPLLYAGDQLIAVGDLWQDARWCVAPGEPGMGCVWQGAPLLV